MMYAFKVTAKQNIAGKIAKGMSVQVVEQNINSPQLKTTLEAFKNNLELKLKEFQCQCLILQWKD